MYRRSVNLVVRPGRRTVALLVAAAGCALVLASHGLRPIPAMSGALAQESSTYTLMQTNLCLSGRAGCFRRRRIRPWSRRRSPGSVRRARMR